MIAGIFMLYAFFAKLIKRHQLHKLFCDCPAKCHDIGYSGCDYCRSEVEVIETRLGYRADQIYNRMINATPSCSIPAA